MSRGGKGRPRIVVVDDEAIVCESLRIQLEAAGFHAVAVEDPRRALSVVAAERPDLIVLDLYMPGMDGREIARAVKADPAVSSAKILLLTGSSEAVDVVTGLDAGAIDYMTKPVDGEALTAKIRALLAPPSAAAPSPRPARRKKK